MTNMKREARICRAMGIEPGCTADILWCGGQYDKASCKSCCDYKLPTGLALLDALKAKLVEKKVSYVVGYCDDATTDLYWANLCTEETHARAGDELDALLAACEKAFYEEEGE